MSNAEQAAGARSTVHSIFVIERSYAVAPQRVFDAWADPEAKTQWFGPPQKPAAATSSTSEWAAASTWRSRCRMGRATHMTPPTRTSCPPSGSFYTYDMHRGDTRISVSLAAVEIEADGGGAKLRLTEHGIYLDGQDTPEIRGTGPTS